ncbi:KH domain-containing protein, partial [Candidatus Woesearchaeota archaeon]|nr:KH domain-containing protein [Candidatus Woesearchaeota archaeon]
NKPMYELYTYGEQTVLVPVVEQTEAKGLRKLASDSIRRKMQQYSKEVEVEVLSDNKAVVRVPDDRIAGIIGKQGSNISKIEQELGLSIDVQELKIEKKPRSKKGIKFDVLEDKNLIKFQLNPKMKGKEFELFIDGVFIMNAVSNKKSIIRFNKKNEMGAEIEQALNYNKQILLVKK